MSDSAAIEAIADAFVSASNDGVALAEDYAEYVLAALRADGEFVLVEKVNGEWPPVPCVRCGGSGFIFEDRPGFVAEKLGCFDCDGDGVAPRNVVKAILDALAEGEQ